MGQQESPKKKDIGQQESPKKKDTSLRQISGNSALLHFLSPEEINKVLTDFWASRVDSISFACQKKILREINYNFNVIWIS